MKHIKTLTQLCDEIQDAYLAGLTMFDAPLTELIQELADRTEEIKELVEKAEDMGLEMKEAQIRAEGN